MVLRGNMGLGPNSGLAGAQRRSSAASAGTGAASSGSGSGAGSGSGVKVEVFDVSLPGGSLDQLGLRIEN